MRFQKKSGKSCGFSLVEFVISSSISLLVTGGLIVLMISYGKTAKGVFIQNSLDQKGRKAIRQLQIDIRRCIGIKVFDAEGAEVVNSEGVKMELTFPTGAGETISTFEFSDGQLLYDSDGPDGDEPEKVLLAAEDIDSSFTLVQNTGELNRVTIRISFADPFAGDNLQLFLISTTVSSRILPSV